MAQQIKFFKENKIDLSNPNVSITITDSVATSLGDPLKDYIRNRNNRSAWLTTGSSDAGTTTLTIDMGDDELVDELILIKHNWKAFTIKYWDGFAYQDFSTAISETTNSDDTTAYSFTQVTTSRLQIIITGTQTADDDKYLYQLIVGELKGQLAAWPEVRKPQHVANKKRKQMLSGKMNMIEPIGRFSVQLSVKHWKSAADLATIESIYRDRNPVLIWLCGGDEDQFLSRIEGYRLEDVYLVRPSDDYTPEFDKFVYKHGLKLRIKFDEVVD